MIQQLKKKAQQQDKLITLPDVREGEKESFCLFLFLEGAKMRSLRLAQWLFGHNSCLWLFVICILSMLFSSLVEGANVALYNSSIRHSKWEVRRNSYGIGHYRAKELKGMKRVMKKCNTMFGK
ncbi:hypothetical protein [Candidatus Bartonella washoeensis]|uniref:Uncharacterized protein n=1 Tax=Cardidatus Bartonella washoeensis 085-0475 TaxID=1094564 RepID=J1JGQ1_9HYPH|nr:hypothetical protein [Bartonella washoeensis]EJF83727.1 hypothetical protein MCW_01276 [Bartonella washoeensis 085-0475]